MTTLAVLRPEPGNAATIARARAAGFKTVSVPLFAVQALAWDVPDAARFDSLILTSANALRFGGPGLEALRQLPVLAVGPRTAAAARAASFDVMATGEGTAADIAALASANGFTTALHLTGRDRTLERGGPIAAVVPVYESAPIPIEETALRTLAGTIALLHSARAARRLGALVDGTGMDRATLGIAAFSSAIATAAGHGWREVAVAATPDDAALFAAVRATSR
ncbi:uroporphyrinogen-III synthase [Sphingomonas echinoides]|uniref:Uroporphyrinogen-III synthase n=1 Tax=Sphingomonas echinoides TaxID=59803 RepID=A0ABU4PIE1_9SPHN|nr:uroporphyrinogen-III synthase [Sphingomonas echinoides]MDX5982912.1 uroporphyrinogen-III synthase [Sphingomonas echinoides]